MSGPDIVRQVVRQMDRARLLELLPDAPCWVETRDLLLHPECPLLGDDDATPSFVVFDPDDGLASVVGAPDAGHVRRAAAESNEILAFPGNVAGLGRMLPDWSAEEVAVHVLDGAPHAGAAHPARLLEPAALDGLAHLPAELAGEIADVAEEGKPIAAAFDGALAVAFAYPASRTESLWDVSIDTVPTHRRRGYAQAAARSMIAHMAASGRAPVWCAAQSNPASAALAAKLGFVRVDTIWLLTRSR